MAIDTDVLVHWGIRGAPQHDAARGFFQEVVREGGGSLGLTQQVLCEFLHVVTDRRRFERPLAMDDALDLAHALWRAEEVRRIVPNGLVFDRTRELLSRHRLGRKRILDTALAATLEVAGIRRLATFNPRDFAIFPFLDLVRPD